MPTATLIPTTTFNRPVLAGTVPLITEVFVSTPAAPPVTINASVKPVACSRSSANGLQYVAQPAAVIVTVRLGAYVNLAAAISPVDDNTPDRKVICLEDSLQMESTLSTTYSYV